MTLLRTSFCCVLALAAQSAAAKDPDCVVDRFQGAASPGGADVRMRLVNLGKPCAVANHGVASERSHPAESGAITKSPAHGTAVFAAPDAVYMPAKGFVGNDEFAYEAFAKGKTDQRVRLRVRVRVEVVAP